MAPPKAWVVYVARSASNGAHYVGCTTDPLRRIRQHNGELVGGGRYTSKHRPWALVRIYGPYYGQSEALKAERALKKGKRGRGRVRWALTDSPWYREHPEEAAILATISASHPSLVAHP